MRKSDIRTPPLRAIASRHGRGRYSAGVPPPGTGGYLLKSQLLLGMMRGVGAIGGMEGDRGLAITASYVNSFFDVYLKGQPRTALDTLAIRYPEVSVE